MPITGQSGPADYPFAENILHSGATFFTAKRFNVHLELCIEESDSKSPRSPLPCQTELYFHRIDRRLRTERQLESRK